MEILILGNKFNKTIDELPSSIRYLELGFEFNQPINNLPENLKILKLSLNFNQPINNLPDTIEELYIISHDFYQEITKLPKNLKILWLPIVYPLDLTSYRLENLIIYRLCTMELKLPENIQNLYIDEYDYGDILNFEKDNNIEIIPKSTKRIYLISDQDEEDRLRMSRSAEWCYKFLYNYLKI